MRIYLLTLFLCLVAYKGQSQVLISLLFGDKLNSDKMEFGLDGGLNWATLTGIDEAKYERGVNLGFYFEIKMQEKFLIHTGIIVKSPLGARKIDPYLLDDPELDAEFADGSVTRNIRYFHFPVMAKYYIYKRFSVEAGPMIGLRTKAFDEFRADVRDKEDLRFENDIRDQVTRFDVGILTGVGYRLIKGYGMNVGLRYYFGLVDVYKDPEGFKQKNSSIYAYIGIPIGAGKKDKAAQKEAAEKAAQ